MLRTPNDIYHGDEDFLNEQVWEYCYEQALEELEEEGYDEEDVKTLAHRRAERIYYDRQFDK
jgi:hypothetical protein